VTLYLYVYAMLTGDTVLYVYAMLTGDTVLYVMLTGDTVPVCVCDVDR